jgi:hypothetical protein
MESITEALNMFRSSAERFAATLADASVVTWVFKPSPSVWSMAEVVEHVTTTDRGIRGLASRALRPFEEGEHRALDDAAIATIFDGDGPPPPDMQEPTGTWTDPASAIEQFTKTSDALAGWYEDTDADLRSSTYPHPIFGLLDGVQWLLFAAAHHDNHTRDVRELHKLARRQPRSSERRSPVMRLAAQAPGAGC